MGTMIMPLFNNDDVALGVFLCFLFVFVELESYVLGVVTMIRICCTSRHLW